MWKTLNSINRLLVAARTLSYRPTSKTLSVEATLHHKLNMFHLVNVFERIVGYGDDVGEMAWCDRSDLIQDTNKVSTVVCHSEDDVHRFHAGFLHEAKFL